MPRLLRALLTLTLLSGLAFVSAPQLSRAASAASSAIGRGRLGSPAASFAGRFGRPATAEQGVRSYRAKGYATIVVTFDHDRALDLVVTAPRGAAWSPAEARSVIRRFLPADAALDPTRHASGDGRWALACASNALAVAFSRADYRRLGHAGDPGECFALESPDSAATISAIEISIGRAGALARATPAAGTPAAATPTPSLLPPPPAPAETTDAEPVRSVSTAGSNP